MTRMRIKSLPIGLAEPGMVVAREVRNADGQVLLQTGTTLSESSMSALLRRNVGHISIFQEDTRSAEELQAERARVVERINHLFGNVPQDGTMGMLRQAILEYRMEALS
ncbi:MAG: hypothetical protein U1C96_02770 [Gallionella sp.]|nr:hypothetical protein [Gallionella sp.]